MRTDQQVDNPFAQTVSNATGLPIAPSYIHGGLSQIPSSIREPLTQNPVREGYTKVGGPGNEHFSGNGFPTLDELSSVADILGHGDPSQQLGSDIDRALIVRSGEIAGAAVENSNTGKWESDGRFAQVQDVLDRTIGIAGNDHIAVHDSLMTGRDGGPGAASAMPESFNPDGTASNYDASQSITNLLSFDWADGAGGENTGVNNLFGWIGEAAIVPEGASANTLAEAWRAGESGSELARIIAENKDSLVDIDGSAALGEVNPELTRTLADALAPQIGDLAGAPDGLFTTNGAVKLDGAQQMANLFQVLDTDAEAGRAFNTAAVQTISYAESTFGQDTSQSNLGAIVGRIEGAMYVGLAEQTKDDTDDSRYAATVDYANKGGLFDSGKAIVGSIPMASAVKVAIDVAAPWAKLDTIGYPPDLSKIGADESYALLKNQLDSSTTTTDRYVDILNSYAVDNPGIRSHPGLASYFGTDGMINLEGKDSLIFEQNATAVLGLSLLQFEQARSNGLEPKDWE
jgi:hypothetical protein